MASHHSPVRLLRLSLKSHPSKTLRYQSRVGAGHSRSVPSRYQSSIVVPTSPAPSPSRLRRTLRATLTGFALFTLGLAMTITTAAENIWESAQVVSDMQTLQVYKPSSDLGHEIDQTINSHPLVLDLRTKEDFVESRPHLKIPKVARPHNLTASTLMGPGRVEIPPYAWNEKGGKSLVSISYLGKDLCGHPGIIHGGFLATMLDEGMAMCCFDALPGKAGMTANLNINYRSPAQAENYVVLKAKTTKVEGRKAWVEGRIETLPQEGEEPRLIADATALFISPRRK